jgi:excisionase family DNA binding protein
MENHQPFDSMKTIPEPLLNADQVALRLHLSRSCTYSLMQSGAIPTVRLGRSRRVRSEDLGNFIKHNIYSTFVSGK